eukprot:CFRG7875T1
MVAKLEGKMRRLATTKWIRAQVIVNHGAILNTAHTVKGLSSGTPPVLACEVDDAPHQNVSSDTPRWKCCESVYENESLLRKHVGQTHREEIEFDAQELLQTEIERMQVELAKHRGEKWKLPADYAVPNGWPIVEDAKTSRHRIMNTSKCISLARGSKSVLTGTADDIYMNDGATRTVVLLFYKYVLVPDPIALRNWYMHTCLRLNLTGKVRVASEGVNITVAGTWKDAHCFSDALVAHPITNLVVQDIKSSFTVLPPERVFDGLTVNVYSEIVPMGVHSGEELNCSNSGRHLSPAQFHELLGNTITVQEADKTHANTKVGKDNLETEKDDVVVVDCRNYYESAIGHFESSINPDIRKFKYWPEYVDKNLELFRNKTVAMYCTGGIRCELGSAYLVKKGVAKDVVQLDGGIHRYIEEYPNGFYKGKLYVFDNRGAIVAKGLDEGTNIKNNNKTLEVIARCRECACGYDEYKVCESGQCSQLVLVCDSCREKSGLALVTCCNACAGDEQCLCVEKRERAPVEVEMDTIGSGFPQ